jgi:hypothetical protein
MDLGSGIQDLGSGKNLFRIPVPGVKKAPDPGSGSATLLRWHSKDPRWQSKGNDSIVKIRDEGYDGDGGVLKIVYGR